MKTDQASALLALDTATEACSAAVVVGDTVLARRFEPLQRGHAERLMPMVEAVMNEAGVNYKALGAIAVTVGPGSFTGVRVGLATARGLALAAAVPLIGISTLEALAAAVPESEVEENRLLCALDALRGQVYAQWFDAAGGALTPPMAASATEAADALGPARGLVVGSGAKAILAALEATGRGVIRRSHAPDWPDAAIFGRLVARRATHAGGAGRLAQGPVSPLYLRDAGARPLEGFAAVNRPP